MSGHPGQLGTLPKMWPDDARPANLPRSFDSRSRIAKDIAKRRKAFAEDPAQVMQNDLEEAYHALTLWRQHKEAKLRVRSASPLDAEKIYLGLTNAWLGVFGRLAPHILTPHRLSDEERIAAAFASDEPRDGPVPESEDAP